VFHLLPNGTFTTLHRLTTAEGCGSLAALIEGRDGRFYGTTDSSIFSIARDGQFRLLHSSGGVPGWAGSDRYGWGFGTLAQGNDGNFYGTARFGARPGNNGAVFRLNAVRSACVNEYQLIWGADPPSGRLYALGAIKTETPAFLASFFVSGAGITPLSVGAIPVITPTVAYEQSFALPPIGTVGVLSILVTSDLHVCSAWQTADTGVAGARR
jgi:uncharacterized repeat protein (TIGR03803 family)